MVLLWLLQQLGLNTVVMDKGYPGRCLWKAFSQALALCFVQLFGVCKYPLLRYRTELGLFYSWRFDKGP